MIKKEDIKVTWQVLPYDLENHQRKIRFVAELRTCYEMFFPFARIGNYPMTRGDDREIKVSDFDYIPDFDLMTETTIDAFISYLNGELIELLSRLESEIIDAARLGKPVEIGPTRKRFKEIFEILEGNGL